MVAEILRVWPGTRRVTVIARDHADGVTKTCYCWLPEQQWIAAACDRALANGHPAQKRPIVLTVEPRDDHGFHIQQAELLPATEAQMQSEARIAARVQAMPT